MMIWKQFQSCYRDMDICTTVGHGGGFEFWILYTPHWAATEQGMATVVASAEDPYEAVALLERELVSTSDK